ncbi:MAG: 30S ribosomal protein S1, partial [Pseudonocardia sp.]|nr:30S ribosomal protein S1 [Pseudonocardia sp.]
YAEAQVRFEQHRKQVTKASEADSEAPEDQNYSSSAAADAPTPHDAGSGSLASDEQLAALREKLSGGV